MNSKPLQKFFTLCLLFLLASITRLFAYDIVVAKDGSGDYTTIQAAVNAAPMNLSTEYTIFIKNGKYVEEVNIPSNKPYLKFVGETVAGVIISFDNYSGKPKPGGGTFGTSNSCTVMIRASNTVFMNITFENTTGDSPQAVAVNVNGDKVIFVNCIFLGGQDTLLTNRDGGKQYFRHCYVDGVVDFIFGGSTAVFDSCVIYPKTRQNNGSGGYITAANTEALYPYGYIFRNCKIMSNRGATSYFLGRPWNNDGGADPAHNKVVWLNTTMTHMIKPEGWTAWNASTDTSIITYAEYQSRKFDGTLVDTSNRVSWSQQLTAAEAATYYTDTNFFGNWDPCAVIGCQGFTPELAVVNVIPKAVAGQTEIQWNLYWGISGVTFDVYKSLDNINFYKIGDITSTNDTNINFQYTDTLPAPGSTHYYYIKSSKSGFLPTKSQTGKITSSSNFNFNGVPFNKFIQGIGAPSASQQYTVSGSNLSGTVTITPPANYELSADNGATWSNATAPITLATNSGNLDTTTIKVRLNGSTAGMANGSIAHTWTGGSYTVNIPVTGQVLGAALPATTSLIYYPLAEKPSDSTSVRSTAIAADTVRLKNYYLANSGATIPAYSAAQGMAFSSASNGNGSWALMADTLSRNNYIQLKLIPYYDYAVVADSIVFNTSFLSAATGSKMAIMYSYSGFTSDSAYMTNAFLGGNTLPVSENGMYNTPALPGMEAAATTNHYSFSFGGASGITVPNGGEITVRIYFSGNSTATANFAKLKDIHIMGKVLGYLSVPATQRKGQTMITLYPNPVKNSFTIKHEKAAAGAQVYIYQLDGRLVTTKSVQTGEQATSFDVSGMVPGNYFGVMINGNQRNSFRFVKE